MSRILKLIILSLLIVAIPSLYAQKAPAKAAAAAAGPNMVAGGLGMSWIDGEAYYLINLAPEVSFGKFGAGLDLNLYISSKDQSIRWQELQRGRFIRYLRWGLKGDDIYARVGILDYARLGHGFIMYLYKNSPSVDNRRNGVEFDLNLGKYGFETVYSDFTQAGVFGLRAYVRPLQFSTLRTVPILGGMEVGATWAGDFRTDSRDTSVFVRSVSPAVVEKKNEGTMNVIGADIGFPILRIPMVNMTLYADYAKILEFGSGEAIGLETNFSGLGLLNIFTKIERRWTTDGFMPNYFDSFYELERYQIAGFGVQSKALALKNLKSPGPGVFGDLTFDFLGFVQVRGTYQKLDKIDTSGVLHLGTNLGDKIPMIVVSAGYDKKYIRNTKDLFTTDERSLLYVDVGYKPYPFMIVSTLYTWTFVPTVDAQGNTSYKPQRRITPKVSIVFPI